MSATQKGTLTTIIPGAQVTVSRTGVTYTLPKTMPSVEARDPTRHPPIGTVLQIMGSFTTLESYTIDHQEGEMATVNYNYTGSNSDAAEDAKFIGGAPDLPPYSFSSSPPPRFELEVTGEAISILRAPYFKNISDADKTVLTAMIQNGPIDSNGNQISLFLSGDARAAEAAAFIKDGIVSKVAPSLIWKEISFNQNWSSVPSEVGFIFTPPGPVPDIDGNWILASLSASGFEAFAETVVRTYQSSIQGEEWPSELYD